MKRNFHTGLGDRTFGDKFFADCWSVITKPNEILDDKIASGITDSQVKPKFRTSSRHQCAFPTALDANGNNMVSDSELDAGYFQVM